MASIRFASHETIEQIWENIHSELAVQKTTVAAAQQLAESVYTAFAESLVLVRIFVTIQFGELPADIRSFVEMRAAGHRPSPTTPVLTLMATRGREPSWNDRRNSQNHAGIPLISAACVDAIPMISRMLKEVGLPLAWFDDPDTDVLVREMSRIATIFYVDDARTALDSSGRRIISATDFVEHYDVKTVFGLGGSYINGSMLAAILFTNERIVRSTAELFTPLLHYFKSVSMESVLAGRIFDDATQTG